MNTDLINKLETALKIEREGLEWQQGSKDTWMPGSNLAYALYHGYDIRVKPERADPLAAVKAAHARGETIQFKWAGVDSGWRDFKDPLTTSPAWSGGCEYRVKPAPEWEKCEKEVEA